MVKKAYVDAIRGQLHYRYSGGGSDAPLVLFHMTSASSAAYEPLMNELDGSVPMFAFDTMNYGESYRTKDEPSIAYIASGLLEAITNLGIEKFHTLGHHTGASIQAEMANIAPDRVLSLMMSGPHYATAEENAYLIGKLATPNPISIKGTQFIAAWSRTKDNFPVSLWSDTDVQAVIMNRDTIDMLRAGEDWCWAYRAVFTHDLPTALKNTNCPKLFIAGAQDPAFTAFHERLLTDFPGTPAHIHPEAGIYYMETHPQDAAGPIRQFIRRLS